MSRRWKRQLVVLGLVVSRANLAFAQSEQAQTFNRKFQSALSQYNAGHFMESAKQLENIALKIPKNFQVEELLGLDYISLTEDAKAVTHLDAAVRLQPSAAPPRTELGACLQRLGRTNEAGEQFSKVVALTPQDYTANHNLGEFYIQAGKLAQAVPLLGHAQQLKPEAYDNGYDLATAEFLLGQYDAAHTVVDSLLQQKDAGELHDLLAQIHEKQGKYVDAANEFEAAAHLDPSENNLFDWGSELLLHRTYDPAIEVFRAAAQRYPTSPRVMIGLGISLYARGLYEESVEALLGGVDLDPAEPRGYLFLSKANYSEQSHTEEVIQRFQRYAQLEPNNALAQYYLAISLWKGGRRSGIDVDMTHVEALLQRSIALDDSLADAYFQLGNLYADRHDSAHSAAQYQRVIQLVPNFADAHYRLAVDFTHMGEKGRAQAEFALYQKLRSEHLAVSDKEGNELQQFVYTFKASGNKP